MTHHKEEDYLVNQTLCDNIIKLYQNQDVMLTYFGGEPLLYWDSIEPYIRKLSEHHIKQRIISNGTLLTDKIVEIINAYNIPFIFSHDGENTKQLRGIDILKDTHILSLLRKINQPGFSSVITNQSTNQFKIYRYIQRYFKQELNPYIFSPLQVYPQNIQLMDHFDWDDYIQGYVDLLQFKRGKYLPEYNKTGLSICSDGKIRNLYLNHILGYMDETGRVINNEQKLQDIYTAHCQLTKCPYYMKYCSNKVMQVDNTYYCKLFAKAHQKVEKLVN
jgi:MoaA/NifB/PqqE/SkfB family radical SAM enzyme